MRYIFFWSLLAAIAFGALLQSCNEQPTTLGLSMLYDTLSVRTASSSDSTPLIMKSENISSKAVIFNSSCVYVGKSDNMTALTLLRFGNIPDSLVTLSESAITECFLEIYPKYYAYGDTSSNTLSFKVFKVSKYWTTKTNCDSLLNPDGSSDYFDQTIQGTYSGQIPFKKDSAPPIKIALNKKMLLDWFTMARDSVINWGIVLKPDDNSNIIRQFSAQVIGDTLNHAKITMNYKDSKDSLRTLTLLTAIDASVVCAKEVQTNDIVLRGGIANKNKLTFDLSYIPSESGILYAEMEIVLNKSLVRKGNMPLDSVIEAGIYATESLDSNPITTFNGVRISGTDRFVFSGINSIIEKIVRNGGKGTVVLYPYGWSLVQSLDYMPFYGLTEPNVGLRPKLKVAYSTRFRR